MNILFILTFFWFILSDQSSGFFIGFAFISVLLIYKFDKKLFSFAYPYITKNSLIAILNLLKEIIISTYAVSKIIWLNKKIISRTQYLPLKDSDHLTQVIEANKITLTPGTMSLKIEENRILTHIIKQDEC